MVTFAQNYVEIRQEKEWLTVKTPGYDEALVDDIKVLHYSQRQWEKPLWKVLVDDLDQQPEQETNLQFVQRICQECCDRPIVGRRLKSSDGSDCPLP